MFNLPVAPGPTRPKTLLGDVAAVSFETQKIGAALTVAVASTTAQTTAKTKNRRIIKVLLLPTRTGRRIQIIILLAYY